MSKEPTVLRVAGWLVGLVRADGWPCAGSKELGKFRGPGRKGDPCPFASLAVLKALSEMVEYRDSSVWHVGTDFRKLKVSFVWHNLLRVLDALSRFAWVREDERFLYPLPRIDLSLGRLQGN